MFSFTAINIEVMLNGRAQLQPLTGSQGAGNQCISLVYCGLAGVSTRSFLSYIIIYLLFISTYLDFHFQNQTVFCYEPHPRRSRFFVFYLDELDIQQSTSAEGLINRLHNEPYCRNNLGEAVSLSFIQMNLTFSNPHPPKVLSIACTMNRIAGTTSAKPFLYLLSR